MEPDKGIYCLRMGTAEILTMRERTVSRLARRIEARGLLGVIHGNRDKSPSNKKPEDLKKSVMNLFEEKYFDYNMTHCLEVLNESHNIFTSPSGSKKSFELIIPERAKLYRFSFQTGL